MTDEDGKGRPPLGDLDDTQRLLKRANEALMVNELRRMLERQAERDLIIEEMRTIIETLSVGHVMAVEEIRKIKNTHVVLLRQQEELRHRQEMIASICDDFSEKLDREAENRKRLAADVEDRD